MMFVLSSSAKSVARTCCRCRTWSSAIVTTLNIAEYRSPAKNQFNSSIKTVTINPLRNSLTSNNAQQIRWKYSKKKSKEDEEELDEEDDFDSGKDDSVSKVVTGHMTSLRADLVLKIGLGIARNKIETLFYESKIRVNGGKITKKSHRVGIGDEVDIIKGKSPVNPNLMVVSRVVVLSAKEHEDGDKITVRMRRYKSLNIENTEIDDAI
ncbi:chromosome 6 open reading frame 203 [Nesidiocoris tenuis]|uniref:Chromosome 6 open reading frame 203 n=1 Tax=Nesidiocoris tenuis TaxID=355587 RepID=A0ABN7ANM2_9HEMI|nr:chromosome 6 open reading frame 203 [Nesidiocoris tenuis]